MKAINILLIMLLMTGSLFAGDNVLSLSNGKGLPGSSNNIVSINLNNQDAVRGLQFRLIDNCDYITVDSIWTENISKPQLFSYTYYSEVNTSEIILLQSKKKLIDPQSGNVIVISYSISKEAPAGQAYNLEFEEITMTDVDNSKLPYSSVNSNFVIESTSGIEEGTRAVSEFSLGNNYPNPFNPVTRIQYSLPQSEFVTLGIYNAIGQKVCTLVNQQVQAGQHHVTWNGINDQGFQVPSGVYFYRIQAGEFHETKTLTLMK